MNGIAFAIALILFVGGILLFGYAFDAGDGARQAIFVGGLVAIVLALVIPFHILKRTDR
jgi:hypothetical protein